MTWRWFTAGSFAILLLLLSGCESLGFYRQAITGQWQLLRARQPLDELLMQEQLDEHLRGRLQVADEILQFGEQQLALDVGKRYRSYVDTKRSHVVWSVFAAEPLDSAGKQWCYPVVGCAPYRGYFNEARAHKVAARYAQRGYETYVGGSAAYSTLGWFADPLLNTFIDWSDADLANLLLHELAHSKVWVNGDVAFNESFANFVGNQAMTQWMTKSSRQAELVQWRQRRAHWRRFQQFAVQVRQDLTQIYQQPLPEEQRLAAKTEYLNQIQACYRRSRDQLGSGRYDELMRTRFNNAFLLSVGTYEDWVPAFARLFEAKQQMWPEFFAAVQELAELSQEARTAQLNDLAQQPHGQQADDQHADQVHCQAFARHGAHRKPFG